MGERIEEDRRKAGKGGGISSAKDGGLEKQGNCKDQRKLRKVRAQLPQKH